MEAGVTGIMRKGEKWPLLSDLVRQDVVLRWGQGEVRRVSVLYLAWHTVSYTDAV